MYMYNVWTCLWCPEAGKTRNWRTFMFSDFDIIISHFHLPILILNALWAFLLFLSLCFFIFNLLFLKTEVIIISVAPASFSGSTFSQICCMIPKWFWLGLANSSFCFNWEIMYAGAEVNAGLATTVDANLDPNVGKKRTTLLNIAFNLLYVLLC